MDRAHLRLRSATASTVMASLLAATTGCGGGDEKAPRPPAEPATWSEGAAPQIVFGQALAGTAWNDPSVLRDGSGYVMWLSGGIPSMNPVVRTHRAVSPDGIAWTIDPVAVLAEGPTGSWDDHRIETPNVIRVGATYHLYYSGGDTAGSALGHLNVGHATSVDGIAWTKDAANPLMLRHGEPGAVYDPASGTIFLYYDTMRARPGYTGDLALDMGIAVATSADGSAFSRHDSDGDGWDDAILEQSAAYPVTAGYVGYSTPHPCIDANHVFHLFYDVVRYPNPSDWRQMAIAHATSTDGIHFTEVERDILVNHGWHSWETRAPAVLPDGAGFKLWFAGHGGINDWSTAAIGYATYGVRAQ